MIDCGPRIILEYPKKVNVWAGILGKNIIGPFLIDGTLNEKKKIFRNFK